MNLNIQDTVNALNDASEKVADITRRKNAALLDTAENTAKTAEHLVRVTQMVDQLTANLETERQNRAAGDEESKRYTKRYNWIMLILTVITAICTIATTAFTFYNLGKSRAESMRIEQVSYSESQPETGYSEHEKADDE